MCMDNSTGVRIGVKRIGPRQTLENTLEVDETNAYFYGKAISKELWRQQAFDMGLPADIYLDIAALASNEPGRHVVKHDNRDYLVEINGLVDSKYGQHREVKSVTHYLC